LKEAKYHDFNNPLLNNKFNETIGEYDQNGNIKSLQRGLTGLMDNLVYTYAGNQLLNVTDTGNKTEGFKEGENSGDDYVYDSNGSMVADKNKDIETIVYNHLNLPQTVTKKNGDVMHYVYTASGTKLSQTAIENGQSKTTDYAGGFVYVNGTLQFLLHEEGRVNMTTAVPSYEYFLKDHLGNVRTLFTSAPETDSHTATMEAENTEEDQVFIKYPRTDH
jgi:hypothetical protein